MENDLLTGNIIEESAPIPDQKIQDLMEPEFPTNMEPESTTEDLIDICQEVKPNQVIEPETLKETIEVKEICEEKEVSEVKEVRDIEEEKVVEADSSDQAEFWCHYIPVRDLIYWKDPRKSGAVLGSSLTVLVSLAYCSVISVLANSLLLLLLGVLLFRVYKYVLQAVHKTSEVSPLQTLSEMDLTVDAEEVKKLVEVAVPILNSNLLRLRSMFLIEDIVDSFKLAVVLWVLTYIGSWFNGLTLVILAAVTVFSLPKVYDTYKAEIDTLLCLVLTQLKETYNNVRAKIPIGNQKKNE